MIARLAPLSLAECTSLGRVTPFVHAAGAAWRSTDYGLIILGGGCAGLSLAMRLAALGKQCPRTLVIERRTEYTNDRTWCFWGECSPQANHLITHTWKRVLLRSGARSVEVDCSSTPYRMIPSEAFYNWALRAIEASDRIDLLTGVSPLLEPHKSGEEWHVETRHGCHRAPTVIDTRPIYHADQRGALLWQSFSGREIECEKPVFDPAVPHLMDFSRVSQDTIRFTYLLPLSGTRALVESTAFGPVALTQQDLAADLCAAIDSRVKGQRFWNLRSESGILPMGSSLTSSAADASFVRAGLGAGAARPSTGYAFQRIQRWADGSARLIAEGKQPGHQQDPLLLKSLDHLFVSVLRSRPELGPDLFLSLFEKTDTGRLIRFLSDCGSLLDYAAIASALPVVPFIREIPRAIWRKSQVGK